MGWTMMSDFDNLDDEIAHNQLMQREADLEHEELERRWAEEAHKLMHEEEECTQNTTTE